MWDRGMAARRLELIRLGRLPVHSGVAQRFDPAHRVAHWDEAAQRQPQHHRRWPLWLASHPKPSSSIGSTLLPRSHTSVLQQPVERKGHVLPHLEHRSEWLSGPAMALVANTAHLLYRFRLPFLDQTDSSVHNVVPVLP